MLHLKCEVVGSRLAYEFFNSVDEYTRGAFLSILGLVAQWYDYGCWFDTNFLVMAYEDQIWIKLPGELFGT